MIDLSLNVFVPHTPLKMETAASVLLSVREGDFLSPLNGFVPHWSPLKMETAASVLLSVREGDFLASLYLKDAYFQIPVHWSSRKLLSFMLEETVKVQGPVLRTVDCPPGLYPSVCSQRVSLGAYSRDSTSSYTWN